MFLGIEPAISSGDFPQHKCKGEDLAAALINPESVTSKPLTSRTDAKPTNQKPVSDAEIEKPKAEPQDQKKTTSDYDLQGHIESDLKKVSV